MVNAAVLEPGDGSCWPKAFKDLQSALAAARKNPNIKEIWVAAGTYYPTASTSRSASFVLVENVGVYGGFEGFETSLAERNPRKNLTILSGDIGIMGFASDNAYHVVKGENSSTLDGVVVTGGYANGNGATEKYGGGVFNQNASPTIRNCVFSGNHANHYGGAIYNYRSIPLIENTRFTSNTAIENTNSAGGAIYNRDLSSPTIVNGLFYRNKTSGYGAALYNHDGASSTVLNCSFSENTPG